MTEKEFKTFLKAIQIRPIKQAMEPRNVKYAPFLSDNVVFNSLWLKRNCVSEKIARMGLEHVIFQASIKKL